MSTLFGLPSSNQRWFSLLARSLGFEDPNLQNMTVRPEYRFASLSAGSKAGRIARETTIADMHHYRRQRLGARVSDTLFSGKINRAHYQHIFRIR
jgi:hypothetical protein